MDQAFAFDQASIRRASELLAEPGDREDGVLSKALPERGIGETAALETLAPLVIGGAARLGSAHAFAHMDPPTPTISWATTLWNAALNQNLLHPDTSPTATAIEDRVIAWLAPLFGMDGGHMTPGSTVANLTALWVAREVAGVRRIAASPAAHLSVRKAAHVLGLDFVELAAARDGTLLPPGAGSITPETALVLTAGHTATGAIDPLDLAEQAGWTHVDAAWAGPLRLSARHAVLLNGIERADSVAVSAHKWLFQPKESGVVFFRDPDRAHAAISFGGAYLARPNVGLLGSHGAQAVPLLATLLAFGRDGVAAWIDRCRANAETLADWLAGRDDCELFAQPLTGVVVWRSRALDVALFRDRLPPGASSATTIAGERWIRNVAANPNLDIQAYLRLLEDALEGPSR